MTFEEWFAASATPDSMKHDLFDCWFQALVSRDAEVAKLRQQLETERMRLAACGVVALSNTPGSAAKVRDMLPEYRSASCDEVARAVGREMELRQQVTLLRSVMNRIAFSRTGQCVDLAQELFDRETWAAEALAATADPKGLRVCYAEPAAIVFLDYGGNGAVLQTELADGEPLYRAREPK